jgi:poly-gamma-glutamate capsule biosynthesis protein CapA/YwtB (metallophosphatase superfamily)
MRKSTRFLWIAFVVVCVTATLFAAEAAWKWSGSYGNKAVEMLIIGDIQIHTRRADPSTAFTHLRETLNKADLVYANLEGVLVKSVGPTIDIPDKPGWTHPGTNAPQVLKANNVKAVGVANNVAYGRDNILQTIKLLDANGIAHAGGGANFAEAHKAAVVESKGVKIAFLQYTARWYREDQQMATPTAPGIAKLASRDGKTVDPADLEQLRNDIRQARAKADIVIVSSHNRDGATAVQFGAPPTPPAAAGNSSNKGGNRGSGRGAANRSKSEEYQKQLAHFALDNGADMVFGHGTHTIQGVEVYKGKPILYALGHSNFDQPNYENAKDGLVVRVVVQGKKITYVSFVPVSRDANNDVFMLDPSSTDGTRLLQIVKDDSPNTPLRIRGQEIVLMEKTGQTSKQ